MSIIQKLLLSALLLCCFGHLTAQPCTEALAESRSTTCKKSGDDARQISYGPIWGEPTAAQVADGLARGERLFPLFKVFLENNPGFMGEWARIVHDKTPEGLVYSTCSLELPRTGCKKEGGFRALKPSGMVVKVVPNSFMRLAQRSSRQMLGDERNSQTDYLDGSAVYVLDSREPDASLNGNPYFFRERHSKEEGLIVTRPGIDFFVPITVRQYLQIQRRHEVEIMADEEKKFAKLKADAPVLPTQTWEQNLKSNAEEYERLRAAYAKYPDGNKKFEATMAEKKARFEKEQQKMKTVFDDTHKFVQTMHRETIEAIDGFMATTEADFLDRPCITNHFGLTKELVVKSTFQEERGGNGLEWVIINPAYLDKNLPPTVPQFFSVWWMWEDHPLSLKAVEALKKDFDFKKLAAMAGKRE